MVQSLRDKVIVGGFADNNGKDMAWLQASCHPVETVLAREILTILYYVKPIYWDIEIQDDLIKIWCGLDPTYGYQMRRNELNKGYGIIRKRGQELIERIEAKAWLH